MAPAGSSNSNIIAKIVVPIVYLSRSERQKTQKPIILCAYQERISLHGLERILGVHCQNVFRWIVVHVKGLPKLRDTLLPAEPEDVLEYDEAWSFVLKKINKRWLWTVMCRRTRQLIAFLIGDRSETTCRRLWERVPSAYRRCDSYSDSWEAHQKTLPQKTHNAVCKENGQVSHMVHWCCTLCQHQVCYVRKTLSFSNCDAFHHMVTK